jgi:hypothetical protein|tara:strand:- start:15 stop:590 length:576 start_codon:yes stop_codon:yes gene_type:complete
MFNVKGNLKAITKGLSKIQKKQIPFAAANAINNTLFDIMKAEKAQMPKKLDRPKGYTVKAFQINKARKTNLVGDIHITPERWKYLKYAVEGGTRTGNVVVPTKQATLNKFGNIKGFRGGIKLKKNQTKETINGTSGIWERSKGRTKLIYGFWNSATYKKIFPFQKIAKGVARKKFPINFKRTLKQAIRTAK